MNSPLNVVSRDGARHEMRFFASQSPHAPVLLCLPAMGMAAEYYRPFAEALAIADAGVAVLLDLRGQGRSSVRARNGGEFGYREILELDLPEAVGCLRQAFHGRRLYLVGHSLGGQLGLFLAARMAAVLDGLILVAAGTAFYRDWPRGERITPWLVTAGVRAAARVLPWYPGSLLGFGGDQPTRLMRDWGRVTTRGEYRPEGSDFDYEQAARSLSLPILSIEVRSDPVAPTTATEALLARAPLASLTRLQVDGVPQHRPWKRHFSWAREPAQVVAAIGGWLAELRGYTQRAPSTSMQTPLMSDASSEAR
jgi:predicted alpha/beta hydrolase